MADLDERIVSVAITVDGQTKTYSTGLQITAVGIKYANANQNQAEIIVENLDKATQDYILTETSPYNQNRTPKTVALYAGRVSYGTSLVYVGNIITSSVSQPPDIKLTLKCLTSNFQKGVITARSIGYAIPLENIAEMIAEDNELASDFQATSKLINTYVFSGAALKEVDLLNDLGFIDAFIDDNTLVVKDSDVPLNGPIKIVNIDTGMIGIPEITQQGVKVKFLVDNQTRLGGRLRLTSGIYPALSGDYIIYKLGFEITSREVPFYYIAECKRLV